MNRYLIVSDSIIFMIYTVDELQKLSTLDLEQYAGDLSALRGRDMQDAETLFATRVKLTMNYPVACEETL